MTLPYYGGQGKLPEPVKLMTEVRDVLYQLNQRHEIPSDLLQLAFRGVLEQDDERARDVLLGQLLTGMMVKGPTVSEVHALLTVALSFDGVLQHPKVRPNLPEGRKLVAAVGSGKKGIKTINITTPAMITAASLGAYVAKPGSSSTSSLTGSADLIRALGAHVDLPLQQAVRVLEKTGIGFYCIENRIPEFDKRYGGRFHAPHALSFGLAALVNPLEVDRLLYGLSHPDLELSAKVLREFGILNAMVVTSTSDGIHYVDEVGVSGETRMIQMTDGGIHKPAVLKPADLSLPDYRPESIAQGRNIEENVQFARNVLSGDGASAHEDVVAVNAGMLLYLSGLVEGIREGYFQAKGALRKGRAMDKLQEFVECTNQFRAAAS